MRTRRLFIIGLAIAPICILWPGRLPAHKLSVFVWVEDHMVYVEGKLGAGKRPKKGTVTVYNGKNKKLFEIEISEDGTASFPLPEDYKTGLKVVMDIGEGHSSYWILTPYDISQQVSK